MNRIRLAILAMAFASPVSAQSFLGAPTDWSGGHLGVQLGFPIDSSVTFDGVPGLDEELEGIVGGGHVGFRRQISGFVYGAELAFRVGEQSLTASGAPDVDVRVTSTRLGGQAGYAVGQFLPYGTLGIGRMTFQDTVGFGDTSSFGTFAGLGVEYRLGQSTSIGVEAIRENFEDFSEGSGVNVSQTNLSVRFNIHY